MLSFVEKQDTLPPPVSKKCFPELKGGVSYDAPTEFHTNHGLYCESSYNNPHLLVPKQCADAPTAQNPIYVQTRSICDQENPESKDNEYLLNYERRLLKSPQQFKRKKGMFVDFLDRNLWQLSNSLVSKGRLKTDVSRSLRQNCRTVGTSVRASTVEHPSHELDTKFNKNLSIRQSASKLATITQSTGALSKCSPLLEKARIRSQRKKFNEEATLLIDKRKLKAGIKATQTTFPLISKLKIERQSRSRSNLEQTIIRERIRMIRAPWYHSKLPISNSHIEQALL